MSASNNTSHYRIFDYWKDKCIDKYGNCYTEGTVDYDITIPMVYDWGEPECFACRMSAIDYGKDMFEEEEYEKALKAEDDSGLKYIYSRKDVKKHLDRAHIIPKALQGKDEPSNYVLLCHRCHRDSPDISNKKLFLSWVFKRRKEGHLLSRCRKKAEEILKNQYGISIPLINLDEALSINIINTHGGILAEETIIYAFVQNALLNKTELKEEYEKMFKFAIEEKIKTIKSKYNVNNSNYSDIDKAILDTLESILTQYNMFKTLEKM